MMRVRRSLLIMITVSAGVHGAGIAALAWVEKDDRHRAERIRHGHSIEIAIESPRPADPRALPEHPVPSDTPAPVDRSVRVADIHTPASPSRFQDSPRAPTRPPRAQPTDTLRPLPETTPSPSTRPATGTDSTTGTERPSLLAMRSRTTPSTTPPTTFDPSVSRIPDLSPERVARSMEPAVAPEPTRSPLELPSLPRIPGPRVERSESMMVPDGNGTYRYDHSGFTAKVERDGSVAITDKPSFQPFFEGPCIECARRTLGQYVEDPSAGYTLDLMALLPKIGMRFDLTDWVMRQVGDDPYSYEKARFLDATRDEREDMRRQETEERLREALQVLPSELARIWNYDGWTVSEKKRALFDLWDECSESGPEDRVRLGRSIRVTILAFIRRRIPADSDHAYTATELEELNRSRKSRERFDPYAATDE